jgi:penicillin-binding protein 2
MLGGAMAAMVAALGARMRYLQVDQADEFKLLAEENRINIRLIPPRRGLIQDRNGKLIAGNEQNYRVVITREAAGDVDLVMRRLASMIPMTAEELAETLDAVKKNSAFVPVIVKDRLSWEDFSKVAINAPALPGVTPEVGLSRRYPRDTDLPMWWAMSARSAKRTLRAGNPDPVLRSRSSRSARSASRSGWKTPCAARPAPSGSRSTHVGRVMRELDRQEGDPGADIRLTIDADVQNFAQARLGEESAAVVVIDVTNGDIICCASVALVRPEPLRARHQPHRLSRPDRNDHRPLANKAVSGAYPPGSTFKMVTALAALDAGVITPKPRCAAPAISRFGGRRSTAGAAAATAPSADAASPKAATSITTTSRRRSASTRSPRWAASWALGCATTCRCRAITEGNMPDKAWKLERHKQEWRIGDTINASIGQGYVLASPLQLAVMTARIASGRAVSPRLVRMIDTTEDPGARGPAPGHPEEHLAAVRGACMRW